jgi:hypothetical protein
MTTIFVARLVLGASAFLIVIVAVVSATIAYIWQAKQ